MTARQARSAVLLAACGIGATSLGIAAPQDESPAANEKQWGPIIFQSVPLESHDEDRSAGESGENRGFITIDPIKSPRAIEMRRRLQDPEERKRLREEQRAKVREQNPELARVLQLDPTVEGELVELLTDEQMEELDRFWLRHSATAPSGSSSSSFMVEIQEQADAGTRRLAKLRALLGEDRFERYQDYKTTVSERLHAIRFDGRLDPADKLSAEQKERLIALLHNQWQKDLALLTADRSSLHDRLIPPGDSATLREQMRRQMFHRESEHIRLMEEASRQLLERLPEVLTPQQIRVYAQMEAEKIAAQRRHLENKLSRAGLTPEDLQASIPAATAPPRKAVAGSIRFDIYMEVNNEPLELSLHTQNGKTVSFQAPEALWVEATPTLYDDGWLDAEFKYYEGPPGRRREIGFSGKGTESRPDQQGARFGGGGGTVIRGSKGYAILGNVNAAPIETEAKR